MMISPVTSKNRIVNMNTGVRWAMGWGEELRVHQLDITKYHFTQYTKDCAAALPMQRPIFT